MATLDEIRQDITQLDQELLALLAKRKTLSIEVARAKQANPRPIRDPQREQDLLVALIQGVCWGWTPSTSPASTTPSSKTRCSPSRPICRVCSTRSSRSR